MDKPWKVILAFLGVFVAGAVFGGFFSLGIGRRIWEMEAPPPPVVAKAAPAPAPVATKQPATSQPVTSQPVAAQQARPAQPPQPVPVDVERAQLMHRVAARLDLTVTQKALITPIIQRAVQDVWRQQQNFYRETTFFVERMKQDVAKELTPEQQARLNDLWAKQLEQFRKRQAEAQAQVRALAQAQQAQAQAKAQAQAQARGQNTTTPATADKPGSDKPGSDDKAKQPATPPPAKDQPAPAPKDQPPAVVKPAGSL